MPETNQATPPCRPAWPDTVGGTHEPSFAAAKSILSNWLSEYGIAAECITSASSESGVLIDSEAITLRLGNPVSETRRREQSTILANQVWETLAALGQSLTHQTSTYCAVQLEAGSAPHSRQGFSCFGYGFDADTAVKAAPEHADVTDSALTSSTAQRSYSIASGLVTRPTFKHKGQLAILGDALMSRWGPHTTFLSLAQNRAVESARVVTTNLCDLNLFIFTGDEQVDALLGGLAISSWQALKDLLGGPLNAELLLCVQNRHTLVVARTGNDCLSAEVERFGALMRRWRKDNPSDLPLRILKS